MVLCYDPAHQVAPLRRARQAGIPLAGQSPWRAPEDFNLGVDDVSNHAAPEMLIVFVISIYQRRTGTSLTRQLPVALVVACQGHSYCHSDADIGCHKCNEHLGRGVMLSTSVLKCSGARQGLCSAWAMLKRPRAYQTFVLMPYTFVIVHRTRTAGRSPPCTTRPACTESRAQLHPIAERSTALTLHLPCIVSRPAS